MRSIEEIDKEISSCKEKIKSLEAEKDDLSTYTSYRKQAWIYLKAGCNFKEDDCISGFFISESGLLANDLIKERLEKLDKVRKFFFLRNNGEIVKL